jgi:hypothetical protein
MPMSIKMWVLIGMAFSKSGWKDSTPGPSPSRGGGRGMGQPDKPMTYFE